MKNVLVIGLDCVRPKQIYIAKEFEHRNVKLTYLVFKNQISIETNKDYDAIIMVDNYISYFLKLVQLLKKNEIIEVYMLRLFPILLYLILSLFYHRNTVVYFIGSDLQEWHNHNILRKIITKLICKKAKVCFLKELEMPSIVKKYNIFNENKIVEIHNCVPIPSEPLFSPRSMNILFLNSFRKFRNVDVLIKAFNLLKEDFPESRLVLMGSTFRNKEYHPAGDDYELYLFNLVKKLGIEDRVDILPFSLETKNVLMNSAVFVLPADRIWLNFSLLEAMAAGIPPIISNVNGAERIIKNGVNGIIVENKNVKELSEAISSLLSNVDLRIRLGNAARETIIRKFNIEALVTKIESVYNFKIKSGYPQR